MTAAKFSPATAGHEPIGTMGTDVVFGHQDCSVNLMLHSAGARRLGVPEMVMMGCLLTVSCYETCAD